MPSLASSTDRTGRGATAALAVAVVAISLAALFFRKAAPTHPLVMAAVRLAAAAVILAPWTLRSARAGRLSPSTLRAALVAGVLYGIHFGAWVSSLMRTTIAASVTLVTATPLLLALVALSTGRDRPDRRHWVAMGLAAIGVSLIGGHDFRASPEAFAGDALALLANAAMAGYLLLVRRQGIALDVWAFSGVACAVAASLLTLAAAGLGVPMAVASTEALAFLVAGALVPQLLGHGLITWSLRHLRPTVVAMGTVGEPVIATLLAWVWLAETPPAVVLAGCAVTLIAVVTALRPQAPSE